MMDGEKVSDMIFIPQTVIGVRWWVGVVPLIQGHLLQQKYTGIKLPLEIVLA